MYSSSILAFASLYLTASVQALSGKQLRIIPLGDSITWGANAPEQGGYRLPLLNLLDGNQLNYVGSIEDGLFRDINHEGWPGYTTNDISSHYIYGGGQANPNVVLVHAGTNDIASNITANVTRAISRMNDLVNGVRFLNPTALLLIAQIGPYKETDGDTQRNNRAKQLNAGYVQIVQNGQNMGWNIDTIDVFNTLTQSDLNQNDPNDLVHPVASGYQKIAQLWYNKMDSINSANPSRIPTPIPHTVGRNSGFYTCSNAANGTVQFLGPNKLSNLAQSQNQFSGITCNADQNNAGQCLCTDPSGPSPNSQSSYPVPAGRSCGDMNTIRTQAVQLGDVNGDNRQDYLYVGPNGQISSWIVTGQKVQDQSLQGRFSNPQGGNVTLQSQPGGVFGGGLGSVRSGIRLADINGDGLDDVLVVGMKGDVTAWINNGVFNTSNFQPATTFANKGFIFSGSVGSLSYPGSGIQFADLDADGLQDLLYIGAAGDITAFKNNGSANGAAATFLAPQTIFNGPGFPFGRDNVIVKDMDGDGRADLIVLNRSNGAFSFYAGLPAVNGQFQGFNTTARISNVQVTQDGSNYVFGDIAGNGRACLVDVNPNDSSINTYSNACFISGFGFAQGFLKA